MRAVRTIFAGVLAVLSTLGTTRAASANGDVAIESSSLQHALVVSLAADERAVYAAGCRSTRGCRVRAGTRYPIPAEADADRTTVEAIELESGRRVVLVSAPAIAGPGRWILLLTASKRDQAAAATKSLVGMIEEPKALEGERRAKVLLRESTPTGTVLRVGDHYEHADLCGRPTTLRVATLDPYELLWESSPTMALSDRERRDATALTASVSDRPWSADAPRLLYGKLASSAVDKSRGAMTDGDLTTRWAEGRDGPGDGEFLVMTASDEVAVNALDFVLRPTGEASATGASKAAAVPRRVFIATRREVFSVSFPDDAEGGPPGTVYSVKLPSPIRSDCFAVVLDGTDQPEEDAEVGIVELHARTPFEGWSMPEIVAALDDPATADAAAALLIRNESRGVEAAMAAYEGLSADGRRRALDVVGAGACTSSAPFYVDRILGRGAEGDFDPALDPTARLARDRLRRCRSAAATALERAVRSLPPSVERVWAARELAGIAPARAVGVILDVLAEGSTAPTSPGGQDDVRRGLRAALATATRHRRAQRAVGEALAPPSFAALGLVEKIDFLRALGPGLADHDGAKDALKATLAADDGFRTRYLLLEPASQLARAGDPAAVAFLRAALTDPRRPHLRARAAEVSGGVEPLAAILSSALRDDAPRVRRAALVAMTVDPATVTSAVEAEVLRLLRKDRWTFVREEAARALSRRPPSPQSDAALVATLEGAPNRVRVAALRALGERGSTSAAEAILELADSPNEKIYVRSAAIKALGDLCHVDAVPFLYKLARRAGYQQLPYDQPLGLAALAALDHIRPPGLREELRPLAMRNDVVPPQIRAIAKGILARRAAGCGSP